MPELVVEELSEGNESVDGGHWDEKDCLDQALDYMHWEEERDVVQAAAGGDGGGQKKQKRAIQRAITTFVAGKTRVPITMWSSKSVMRRQDLQTWVCSSRRGRSRAHWRGLSCFSMMICLRVVFVAQTNTRRTRCRKPGHPAARANRGRHCGIGRGRMKQCRICTFFLGLCSRWRRSRKAILVYSLDLCAGERANVAVA